MADPVREVKDIVDLSRSYRLHVHDELSVAHVWRGATCARVGGRDVTIAGACVVVIPAGLAHACNPTTPGDWSYTLMLLDPDLLPGTGFCILPSGPDLRRWFKALRAGARDPRALEQLTLALRLAVAGPADAAARRVRPAQLRQVEACLRRDPARPLSLDDLSAGSGLSKFHLVRAFRSAYGLTPHAYLLNLRVDQARARLKRGQPLAEVALDCGFCDQSHLTRAFSRQVGLTPAAYQKAMAIPSKTGTRAGA